MGGKMQTITYGRLQSKARKNNDHGKDIQEILDGISQSNNS